MPWQCWQHKHPPNQNHPHPQLIRRRHQKLLSKCTNASQFLISSNALVSAVHNYISSICISSLDWPRQDGWRMLRCEKVEAEMEVRWRQDVFAILDSSPPQHAMIQCGRNTLWTPMQGDDAIMKCARQQCDVWGRTHFKKWVQMYIFQSKATAVCYSRRPKIPFCAATLFTLHDPLCPSWAWQGWRRWWSDDNDWTI